MIECPREGEVFETVAFGRWPTGAAAELRSHVAACPVCRDVADVSAVLHDDRRSLLRAAQPPTAGVVWWRATIRARAEATRTAMQPITWWQGVALACVVGVVAALGGGVLQWSRMAARLGRFLTEVAVSHPETASYAGFGAERAMLVLLGVAACLVLAPVALYFTLVDD
jgi:hypothetical protein